MKKSLIFILTLCFSLLASINTYADNTSPLNLDLKKAHRSSALFTGSSSHDTAQTNSPKPNSPQACQWRGEWCDTDSDCCQLGGGGKNRCVPSKKEEGKRICD
ncbi:MAG: hypothetical protein RL368_2009 [Pseudomonadota bacterium]|jgi:hypothetical protein